MSYLKDGYATLIEFSADPTIKFREVTVRPPGLDGGGPINTTTMRNTAVRTGWPKQLYTLTNSVCTGQWDPDLFNEVLAMIQTNQEINVTFPDSQVLYFWGFLDKFEPQEHSEGEMPLANFTIEPTNENNSEAEVAPVVTATATTTTTTP